MSNNNKQHRCTGEERVALVSWPRGVTVSNVERHKRYLIIYAIDMHGMMLINHYMHVWFQNESEHHPSAIPVHGFVYAAATDIPLYEFPHHKG